MRLSFPWTLAWGHAAEQSTIDIEYSNPVSKLYLSVEFGIWV